MSAPGPEAWHEAGHALAARLLGGEVRMVTLESDLDDHHGHIEVVWRGLDARDLAHRSALCALAGPIAETLFRGEGIDEPDVLATWERDWQEAELRLRELADDPLERDALRKRWIEAILARFEDPNGRERLARIADALDAHGTLDADLLEAADP